MDLTSKDFEKWPNVRCLSLRTENAYLEIFPDFGGTMGKLELQNRLLWTDLPGPEWLNQTTTHGFRGVKLAPFANRVANGQWHWGEKKEQLELRCPGEPHAHHGLVYDARFEVMHHTLNQVSLIAQLGPFQGFPFTFEMKLHYHLENSSLTLTTEVRNLSESTMPYADGWHPYFNLTGGLKNWELVLPQGMKSLETDNFGIPKGSLSEIWPEKIPLADFQADHCLQFPEHTTDRSILLLGPNNEQIKVTSDAVYGFCQLYTPTGDAELAIEPMNGAIDAFNNRLGLTLLSPNEPWRGQVRIEV
jgi:aldose 1-epimerase